MTSETLPRGFAELAASRRAWIDAVLRPWCRLAAAKELRQAELEWHDLAGRVDPLATLWTWAWQRFPPLVDEQLPGVDETHAVEVKLQDGRTVTGFPDARSSRQGRLVLVAVDSGSEEFGPISIDDIVSVRRPEPA